MTLHKSGGAFYTGACVTQVFCLFQSVVYIKTWVM